MAFGLQDTYICVVTAGLTLQSPATGAGDLSEPSLMSQDRAGRKAMCA